MKKALLALMMIGAALVASAQGKFFEECENLDNVTTVYIGKAMIRMVSGSLDDVKSKINLSGMSRKIDSLVIISSETTESARKVEALAGNSFSTDKGYEILMKVTDDDTKMRIVYKSLGGNRNEYVMIVREHSEVSYIIITGSLTPEDVQAYSGKD